MTNIFVSFDGILTHSTVCLVKICSDFSNENATTVVVVSKNTVSSKYLTLIKRYFFKKEESVSDLLKKNPAGNINIPPRQSFILFIKHLNKSFVLYLSNKVLSLDLFLARYGGFVIIHEFV